MLDDISNSKLIILGTTFTFFGVLVLVMAVLTKFKSTRQEHWPRVTGTILKVQSYSGPAEHRGSSVRTSGYSWYFEAEYTYEYDNRTYHAKQVTNRHEKISYHMGSEGVGAPMPEKIESLTNKLQDGKDTSVYVNPNKPHRSFLVYDPSLKGILVGISIGLIFLSIGIIFLRVFFLR